MWWSRKPKNVWSRKPKENVLDTGDKEYWVRRINWEEHNKVWVGSINGTVQATITATGHNTWYVPGYGKGEYTSLDYAKQAVPAAIAYDHWEDF